MKISEIAYKLNELSKSSEYNIGKLQEIRKKILGLTIRPGSNIFSAQTISDKEGWAFHHGGRTELQFNIGFENELLRYGIAFSLEPSRTLPDISIFNTQILILNSKIRESPEFFYDYKMWWEDESHSRSEMINVCEIPDDLIKRGMFIFIGKIMDRANIDYNKILVVFDYLLEVYKLVLDPERKVKLINEDNPKNFIFDAVAKNLPEARKFTTTEINTNLDIRHTILQRWLYNELIKIYGKENVSLENPILNKRIDVVVKTGNEYYFYEVKTGNSVQDCIRQAIGQLLEYAHLNGKKNADKLVIASEFEPTIESKEFLKYLRDNYLIPIEYYWIKI